MGTNNRLAEARAAYCEVGNRCNGKLICYRDCLIALSLSLSLPALLSSLSFRRRSLHLGVNCKEPVCVILPQTKSTCAWISERSWQLPISCLLFPRTLAVADCPPHSRPSPWLMLWNTERCLFLLWLGRRGARWQTTRD